MRLAVTSAAKKDRLERDAAKLATLANHPADATHLVVGTLRPVRRTVKLLFAVANGAWVLDHAYVASSAEKRAPCGSPLQHELHEDVPGCRIARLAKEERAARGLCGSGTLSGLHVRVGGATAVPRDDLLRLLACAGATVEAVATRAWRLGPAVGVLVSTAAGELKPQLGESELLDAIITARPPRFESEIASARAAAAAAAETAATTATSASLTTKRTRQPLATSDTGNHRVVRSGDERVHAAAERTEESAKGPWALSSSQSESQEEGAKAPLHPKVELGVPKSPRFVPLPKSPRFEGAAPVRATRASARYRAPPQAAESHESAGKRRATSQPPSQLPSAQAARPTRRATRASAKTQQDGLPAGTVVSELQDGLTLHLLPPADASASRYFALEAALEIFRSRLPQCNVRVGKSSETVDFLVSLVENGRSHTATVSRADGLVLGAITFVPHERDFAEILLLAVRRGLSRRGLGTVLLGATERWLRARGVRIVAACAGLDCTHFWQRSGYSSDEVSLEPAMWAQLGDPFGNSRILLKVIK